MKNVNTNPPSGTRDFLPSDIYIRENLFNKIKSIFKSYGFSPIDTPVFERIEILMDKYGEEGEKLIFKILKRGEGGKKGETDLALRYDLTVPLARFIAEYKNQLPKIFKRYQIAPVWRADRPGKGRFREFYQCDVDIIGISSLMADVEIILIFSEILYSLDLPEFKIYLNSKKVLEGLLEIYKIPEKYFKDFFIAIDKIDKVGIEGVQKELASRGLPQEIILLIIRDLKKSVDVIEQKIRKYSKKGKDGLDEIDEILKLTTPFIKGGKIVFSPFLARGLDYYTGPIFEIFSKGLESAIVSGGRYDNLLKMFSNKQISACGASLGIERIILLLEKKNKLSQSKNKETRVLVTVWNNKFRQKSISLANEIRSKGIVAEVYLTEDKIGDQVKFASKNNYQYCVFYGLDEERKMEVSIKDLSSGKQISVARDQFVDSLIKIIMKKNVN